MLFETWLLYVTTIFVVILIPGPLSLFMVSNSLVYGITKTAPAFIGGALASSFYLIASATGLGALLIASEGLFSILKIIGAIYLIYLGITTWIGAENAKGLNIKVPVNSKVNKKSMFSKAFFLGASNPKDLLFFHRFFASIYFTKIPAIKSINYHCCDMDYCGFNL